MNKCIGRNREEGINRKGVKRQVPLVGGVEFTSGERETNLDE